MNTKPSIYAYNDFRKYLHSFFEYKRKADKKFTKAYICRRLGLPNTRSYFSDIVKGKLLSLTKVPLFIDLLELNEQEAQFFRVLVNYNQATHDIKERELLFEQLIALNQTPKQLITKQEYAYYKSWYNSVIRALLNIIDFHEGDDYSILSKKTFPTISKAQARSSIQLLLDLKLIQKNKSGAYKPTNRVISTGPFAKDEIIKQYQAKALDNAKAVIFEEQPQPKRVITKMVSVSETGFKRIAKQIERLNASVTSICHKDADSPDRVYQLDIAFFSHIK